MKKFSPGTVCWNIFFLGGERGEFLVIMELSGINFPGGGDILRGNNFPWRYFI
jgi:hypothetical protein